MVKAWIGALCLAGAVLLSAGAFAQSKGSPQEMQAQFRAECLGAGGEEDFCTCAWNGVQARMSADEFTALDHAIRTHAMHPAMAQLALITGECNGTGRASTENPQAYPGFVKTNFINGCSEGGAPFEVCACVMNRIEREMPLQHFMEFDYGSTWGQGEAAPHYQNVLGYVRACVGG